MNWRLITILIFLGWLVLRKLWLMKHSDKRCKDCKHCFIANILKPEWAYCQKLHRNRNALGVICSEGHYTRKKRKFWRPK